MDDKSLWSVKGGKFCKRLDKYIDGLEEALEFYSYGRDPEKEKEYKIRIDEAKCIGRNLVFKWDKNKEV